MFSRKITIGISLLFLVLSTSAQLRLASVFGDHGVLQRGKPIPLWGWSNPREKITILFNGKTTTVKSDDGGRWKISLPAMPAGGPYSLVITNKKDSIQLKDILIGEVWLCGGQSNMEMEMRNAANFKMERNKSNYPMIRQIKVADTISLSPQEDIRVRMPWMEASYETIDSFTAVGFFFARMLADSLKVPIGLINCNWGGSDVESWMSRDALSTSTVLADAGKKYPADWPEVEARNKARLEKAWAEDTLKLESPTEEQLRDTGYNFTAWKSANAPGAWDWMGLYGFRGQGYMQHYIVLNEWRAAQPSVLSLGTNSSAYTLYVNGKKVSEGKTDQLLINLPAGTWHKGRNSIVLKQGADENGPWHSMGIMGDGCQVYLKIGRDKIYLGDDDWKMMPAVNEGFAFGRLTNTVASGPYNFMIRPLQPYALRGFIWYQGEANAGRAYQYRTSFQDLIKSWRKEWGEELPFFFVQLSSFGKDQSSNEGSGWAELREAQAMALKLPGTGIAITTDIGNATDIHPKNKQDVGKRLALVALNTVYKIPVTYQGPQFSGVNFNGSQALVHFQNTGAGLEVKDKYGYLKGFEIAGADKKWFYARASIKDSVVVLDNPAVPNPVAVRYAWSNAPLDANLYNKDGLPAVPFRTDDWPGVTDSKKYEY